MIRRREKGFTLIELMIVVAIIAILAAVAIPQYRKFQMRAKTAEAKSNIGAIRTAEEGWAAEYDKYILNGWYPGSAGSQTQTWDPDADDAQGFTKIGFKPAGSVYYDYCVVDGDETSDLTAASPSGFDSTDVTDGSVDITIIARGDLDGDNSYSYLGATDETPGLVGPHGDDF